MKKIKKAIALAAAVAITAMSVPVVYAEENGAVSFLNPFAPNETEIYGKISEIPDETPEEAETDPLPEADITYSTGTAADFNYSISGGEVTITDYKGTYTDLIIPDTIEGYPVKYISSAFRSNKTLRSVIIPNSVVSLIGYSNTGGTFEGCTSLTNVTLSSNLQTIGYDAFNGCTSLTAIEIPNTVKLIKSCAFQSCTSLTKITIPDSVTSIEWSAFYGCTSLAKATLSDGIVSIGKYAFENCTSLTTITIPDSVSSIGAEAFRGCTGLTSAKISNSVTKLSDSLFYNCTALRSVTLPSEITSIESYAFNNCTNLTSVTIPESVTSIGDYAFYGCKSVRSFTIPEGVTNIGQYSFANCWGITSITVPKNVSIVGGYAFYNCTNLRSAVIENGVLNIGNYAFYGCTALKSVTIPASVMSIYKGAFKDCTALTGVKIPSGVMNIYSEAFRNCDSITSISVPSTVMTIGADAFRACDKLSSVTIAEGVEEIGSGAFSYCPALTELKIPNGVKIISSSLCSNDTSLKNAVLPSSAESIEASAFYGCSSLTSITVPEGVSSIGDSTFYKCTNLTRIIIPESVTSIEKNTFKYCDKLTIYGYTGSYAEDYAIANGIDFADVNEEIYSKPQITSLKPGDGQVAVNWTAVNGATNYAVYFYQGGKWTCAGTRTSTGMYVKNLTNGVKYGFAVKAYVNGSWTAITSADIVYATPVGVSKPKITKAAPGNGQVALNWTAVSGATQYAVYYRSGSKWIDAGRTSSLGKYVKGLTNGTKYAFAVKAYVNGAWTGISSSDIVYATPVSASSKPKITKTIIGNGQVGLNWTAVNGAAQYAVYYKYNGVWTLAGTTTAQGKYVRGLKNGVTYGFAVKAYVNGAWTAISSSDIVYAAPSAAKASLETDITDIEFTDIEPEIKF